MYWRVLVDVELLMFKGTKPPLLRCKMPEVEVYDNRKNRIKLEKNCEVSRDSLVNALKDLYQLMVHNQDNPPPYAYHSER